MRRFNGYPDLVMFVYPKAFQMNEYIMIDLENPIRRICSENGLFENYYCNEIYVDNMKKDRNIKIDIYSHNDNARKLRQAVLIALPYLLPQ